MKAKREKKPNPLSRPVAFRLTQMDYDNWRQKVEESGLRPSEFFRDCVLQNRTEVIARKRTSKDKAKLIYYYSAASNNINQLAKAANSARLSGTVSEALYSGLLAELHSIATILREEMKHVE